MAQPDVDYVGQTYISIGKNILGPNWSASVLSEAQIKAIGAAAYATYPAVSGTQPKVIPPSFTVSNPGTGVEAANAEVRIAKNPDGSMHGRIPGTSVVVNLPG